MKIVSLSLSCLLFLSNTALAHASEANFWLHRKRALQEKMAFALPRVPIPAASPLQKSPEPPKTLPAAIPLLSEKYGHIHRVIPSQRTSDSIVVLIQDIHLEPEAQQNISRLIQGLGHVIDLIGVEGQSGPIDIQPFRDFEDPESVRKAADFLLRHKKITSAAHAGLSAPRFRASLVGVDDDRHYRRNVEAYLHASRQAPQGRRHVQEEWWRFETEGQKGVRPELVSFEKTVRSYRDKKLALGDYLAFLAARYSDASIPKKTDFPHISNFLKARVLERRLDFKAVQRSRDRLIERLVSQLDSRQREELIKKAMVFRLGDMGFLDFYGFLDELSKNQNIDIEKETPLKLYFDYVYLSESIQAEPLFEEMARLEETIYDSLAQTTEEQEFVKESRFLSFAEKLVHFSLTRQEWEKYKKQHKACRMRPEKPLHATCFMPHAEKFSPFEKFYEEADIRDSLIASNFSRAATHQNARFSFLIAGGFHSYGLIQRLREKNFSIVVFSPRVTKINNEDGSAYLSIFAQEKTPLEKLFESPVLSLSIPAFSPGLQRVGALLTLARRRRLGQNLEAKGGLASAIGFDSGGRFVNGTDAVAYHAPGRKATVKVPFERTEFGAWPTVVTGGGRWRWAARLLYDPVERYFVKKGRPLLGWILGQSVLPSSFEHGFQVAVIDALLAWLFGLPYDLEFSHVMRLLNLQAAWHLIHLLFTREQSFLRAIKNEVFGNEKNMISILQIPFIALFAGIKWLAKVLYPSLEPSRLDLFIILLVLFVLPHALVNLIGLNHRGKIWLNARFLRASTWREKVNAFLKPQWFSIPRFDGLDPAKKFRLALISDVDGVARGGRHAAIDPIAVSIYQTLLNTKNVAITFISGSPVVQDQTMEELVDTNKQWRRDNEPLGPAFREVFAYDENLRVLGSMGGQQYDQSTGQAKILATYESDQAVDALALILEAYLRVAARDAKKKGRPEIRVHAEKLLAYLHHLCNVKLVNKYPRPPKRIRTHRIFEKIVMEIINHIDPGVRLIWRGSEVEMVSDSKNVIFQFTELEPVLKKLMKQRAGQRKALLQLDPSERLVFSAAHFIKISRSTKETVAREMRETQTPRKRDEQVLVVAVGDQSVDVPMYREAHLGFHMGPERLLSNEGTANTVLVRDIDKGSPDTHVEGNRQVLFNLRYAIINQLPFGDFRFFQVPSEDGKWLWMSLNELKTQLDDASPLERLPAHLARRQTLFLTGALFITLGVLYLSAVLFWWMERPLGVSWARVFFLQIIFIALQTIHWKIRQHRKKSLFRVSPDFKTAVTAHNIRHHLVLFALFFFFAVLVSTTFQVRDPYFSIFWVPTAYQILIESLLLYQTKSLEDDPVYQKVEQALDQLDERAILTEAKTILEWPVPLAVSPEQEDLLKAAWDPKDQNELAECLSRSKQRTAVKKALARLQGELSLARRSYFASRTEQNSEAPLNVYRRYLRMSGVLDRAFQILQTDSAPPLEKASPVLHEEIVKRLRHIAESVVAPGDHVMVVGMPPAFDKKSDAVRDFYVPRIGEYGRFVIEDPSVSRLKELPSGSLDVFVIDGLEGIYHPGRLLVEAERLLKPRGRLLLTASNYRTSDVPYDPSHVCQYNQPLLANLINRSNLQVVQWYDRDPNRKSAAGPPLNPNLRNSYHYTVEAKPSGYKDLAEPHFLGDETSIEEENIVQRILKALQAKDYQTAAACADLLRRKHGWSCSVLGVADEQADPFRWKSEHQGIFVDLKNLWWKITAELSGSTPSYSRAQEVAAGFEDMFADLAANENNRVVVFAKRKGGPDITRMGLVVLPQAFPGNGPIGWLQQFRSEAIRIMPQMLALMGRWDSRGFEIEKEIRGRKIELEETAMGAQFGFDVQESDLKYMTEARPILRGGSGTTLKPVIVDRKKAVIKMARGADEGKKLDREARYLDKTLPRNSPLRSFFPAVHGLSEAGSPDVYYAMDFFEGGNLQNLLAEGSVSPSGAFNGWARVFEAFVNYFDQTRQPAPENWETESAIGKVKDRLSAIKRELREAVKGEDKDEVDDFYRLIAESPTLKTDGVTYLNMDRIILVIEALMKKDPYKMLHVPQLSLAHLDLFLANILRNNKGEIRAVDPRGDSLGDLLYDVAKAVHGMEYESSTKGDFFAHPVQGSHAEFVFRLQEDKEWGYSIRNMVRGYNGFLVHLDSYLNSHQDLFERMFGPYWRLRLYYLLSTAIWAGIPIFHARMALKARSKGDAFEEKRKMAVARTHYVMGVVYLNWFARLYAEQLRAREVQIPEEDLEGVPSLQFNLNGSVADQTILGQRAKEAGMLREPYRLNREGKSPAPHFWLAAFLWLLAWGFSSHFVWAALFFSLLGLADTAFVVSVHVVHWKRKQSGQAPSLDDAQRRLEANVRSIFESDQRLRTILEKKGAPQVRIAKKGEMGLFGFLRAGRRQGNEIIIPAAFAGWKNVLVHELSHWSRAPALAPPTNRLLLVLYYATFVLPVFNYFISEFSSLFAELRYIFQRSALPVTPDPKSNDFPNTREPVIPDNPDPLTGMDRLTGESNLLLDRLSRNNFLDPIKLAYAEDYAASLPGFRRPIFVDDRDPDKYHVSASHDLPVVFIPERFVRSDTPDTLYNRAWPKSDDRLKHAVIFEKQNDEVADYYLNHINQRLQDVYSAGIFIRYLKWDILFRLGWLEFLRFLTNRFLSSSPHPWLPRLVQRWYGQSHGLGRYRTLSLKRRHEAGAMLRKTLVFITSIPESLDPARDDVPRDERLKRVRAPIIDDLLRKKNVVFNPALHEPPQKPEPHLFEAFPLTKKGVQEAVAWGLKQSDRAVYSGQLVERIITGGLTRRLGWEGPASLMTPRGILQRLVEKGKVSEAEVAFLLPAYPDVPLLGRYILQKLARVKEIARRNNWDEYTGLLNQRFLIPINATHSKKIIQHFIDADFYGLPFHNFYFLIQNNGPGFGMKNGVFVKDLDFGNRPISLGTRGNGDLMAQHNRLESLFTVDKKGNRYYRHTSANRLFSSQQRLYDHHQISFNHGMDPNYLRDQSVVAVGLAAVRLGLMGSNQLRQDQTGIIGAGIARLDKVGDDAAAFFQTSQPRRTILLETAMLGSSEGYPPGVRIKNKFQGLTFAAVSILDPAHLARLEWYTPTVTARGKVYKHGDREYEMNVNLDLELWGYSDFNIDEALHYDPGYVRDETKREKDLPGALAFMQRQDNSVTNQAYTELAERAQELLNANAAILPGLMGAYFPMVRRFFRRLGFGSAKAWRFYRWFFGPNREDLVRVGLPLLLAGLLSLADVDPLINSWILACSLILLNLPFIIRHPNWLGPAIVVFVTLLVGLIVPIATIFSWKGLGLSYVLINAFHDIFNAFRDNAGREEDRLAHVLTSALAFLRDHQGISPPRATRTVLGLLYGSSLLADVDSLDGQLTALQKALEDPRLDQARLLSAVQAEARRQLKLELSVQETRDLLAQLASQGLSGAASLSAITASIQNSLGQRGWQHNIVPGTNQSFHYWKLKTLFALEPWVWPSFQRRLQIKIVDALIDEAAQGEPAPWMARNYKPGYLSVEEDTAQGGGLIDKKIRDARRHLEKSVADPYKRKRAEALLGLLRNHPAVPRLSTLQYEGLSHRLVNWVVGENAGNDPYKRAKWKLDLTTAEAYQWAHDHVFAAADWKEQLRRAALFAGIGNLFDETHEELGLTQELNALQKFKELYKTVEDRGILVDDTEAFVRRLEANEYGRVLYFLDNHGELIFDLLLVKVLLKRGYGVTLVGRGDLVFDDVAWFEAEQQVEGRHPLRLLRRLGKEFNAYTKIGQLNVVTDGGYLLGADLRQAHRRAGHINRMVRAMLGFGPSQYDKFLKSWQESDVYISMGGGNFNMLYGQSLSLPGLHIRGIKKSKAALRRIGQVKGTPLEAKSKYDVVFLHTEAGFQVKWKKPAKPWLSRYARLAVWSALFVIGVFAALQQLYSPSDGTSLAFFFGLALFPSSDDEPVKPEPEEAPRAKMPNRTIQQRLRSSV